jgi:hypothetical protein
MIVDEFDIIDYEAGCSDDILGAECQSCARLLTFAGGFFPKNSAYKSGYGPQCFKCLESPRLSIAEHTSRLQEMNYNSYGTRAQRHPDTDLIREERAGRAMDCSLFVQKLHHIYPALYITQGGIAGDLALYATSGVNKPEFSGNSFKYMGYVTLGVMPEYSKYEFDQRDILLRCTQMGWRSVLIRFIENNLLTEEQCQKEFGPPSGGVNSIWYKKLSNHRNAKKI